MRPAVLLLLLAPFTGLRAQTAAQIVGIQQDITELRAEVEKLRLENADLRAEVSRLRTSPAAPAVKPVDSDALGRQRAEILAELDRRLKQQTADVNAALAEMTKQVNAALGRPAAVTPAPAAPSSPTPTPAPGPAEGFPADMPQTGVKYTVRPGDSVIRVARNNKSKVEWILKANSLTNPNDLKAGSVIFIPQAE
jgi:hypothetical protein